MLELNTAIHANFQNYKPFLFLRIEDRVSTDIRGKCDDLLVEEKETLLHEQERYRGLSALRLLSSNLFTDIKKNLLTIHLRVRENWSLKNIKIFGLSVKGIRVEGKCPNCKSTRFGVDETKGFVCRNCLLPPPSDSRYFVDFWHEGERIRRGTTLDGKPLRSFADAHALLRQAENEKEAHKFDISKWREKEKKEFSFKVLITQWYEDKEDLLKDKELAPSYVPMLMTYMKHYLIPFFGHRDVRDIRTQDVKEFKKKLSSMSPKKIDLTPKYKKNILGALSHFYECLNDDYDLDIKKPRIPTIEVPEHDFEVISPETQAILLSYIPDEHKPIFVFLFGQGCRPAEARALKWDCIDNDTVSYKRTWSRRILKETTKTRKPRKNYLFYNTRASLPPRRFTNDFVFTHGKKRKPYSGDMLNRLFNKAIVQLNKKLEEVGDPFRLKITLYEATKHSFGTYMRRTLGVPRDVLQKHFGHVKPEQTDKYLKFAAVDAFREIEEKTRKVIPLHASTK